MAKIKFLAELMGAQNGAFTANVLGNVQSNKPGPIQQNTKFAGKVAYENEEVSKIDRARRLLKGMLSNEDFDRQEVLAKLMQTLNITEETATSYFQRIAKEMGLTNTGSDKDSNNSGMSADEESSDSAQQDAALDQEQPTDPNAEPHLDDEAFSAPPVDENGDPNRQGVIRVIQNAHLVYKRQNEEGTFDELWIYNTGDHVKDELETRRDILAGTDIPPKRSKSEDGQQAYRLTNLGNAQMLEITGLPQ